jgi:hypothetical protein
MPLAGFKAKYLREVHGIKGIEGAAPFLRPGGGDGLLIAQTVHPLEYQADESKTPTVAGMPVDTLEYNFIDGQLSAITASWPLADYATVVAALKTKYGKPALESEAVEGHRAAWKNEVSTLAIFESRGRNNCSLLMVDKKLHALTKARR